METDDATKVFGGRYEFMGVSTRPAEAASRHDEMIALKRAIDKGLAEIQTATPGADVVRALPAPLLIGLDIGLMSDVLGRYRAALYPAQHKDRCRRLRAQRVGSARPRPDWSGHCRTAIA